jgi:NADH dehydrogenase I D subunit
MSTFTRELTDVEEVEHGNFLTTTVGALSNWARKSSLWPYPFGTACCAIEFMAVAGAHYDIARFGSEVVRFSPRQSDVLMVLGTINDKMGPVLKKIYDQMAEPRWVISMGACATCGGFYRAYHVMQGIDEIIPVDVYIPGCPPVPEAVFDAIIKLQSQIQSDTRRSYERHPTHQTLQPPMVDATVHPLEPPSRPLVRFLEEGQEVQGPVADAFRRLLPGEVVSMREFRGDLSVTVRGDNLVGVLRTLKEDPAFDFRLLLDVTAVDHLDQRARRYDVVYHMVSLSTKHRLRLKVPVSGETPEIDSAVGVWRGANWAEREAFDMFGIRFRGHPDLRRIFTHSQFEGHPLRRDFPAGRRFLCTETIDLPVVERTRRRAEENALSEPMILNLGPQHPAMHGTFRLQLAVEGERIVDSDTEIGFLHRCFEKMAETHTYWQIIPFTDRLNYMSAMMNGVAYAMAVEKMFGVEIPKRARYIRVILSELSRIADHLVCVGTNLVDLGAITNFWYAFRPREEIYDLIEACCGSRLTVSYVRIGGVAKDLPEGFVPKTRETLKSILRYVADIEKMNRQSRLFKARTQGVNAIGAEDALDWGFTGPVLRAAGVPYDVRKWFPNYDYDQFEFSIPVGENGDIYDRYLVRMEEIRQSIRIIEQALDNLPDGPFQIDDRRISLPPKEGVYSNIEDLMNHFELIQDGILPPMGEVYSYWEAANGELGFYLVSDGGKHPYRLRCRGACFYIFQAFNDMIKGGYVSDAIAALGSLNIVAGELEK